MAYNPNNLSALSYANGFTMWHYRTSDLLEYVMKEGYFSPAAGMLLPGDVVFVNGGFNENHSFFVKEHHLMLGGEK